MSRNCTILGYVELFKNGDKINTHAEHVIDVLDKIIEDLGYDYISEYKDAKKNSNRNSNKWS